MLFKRILLKIETGQELTEKQTKNLARKLMLIPSFLRIAVYMILIFLASLFLLIAFRGGYEQISAEISYIVFAVLVVGLILLITIPKKRRIKKYLESIEKFYETKFYNYDNLDLYYIDQHISPHIRPLKTSKLYLLTDGYHFLFASDPFMATQYKMPKSLSFTKKSTYLKVINSKITENDQLMIRLDDIDSFYLSSLNFPEDENYKKTKSYNYIKYFLDQTSYYNERCIVMLKLKNGAVLRLSHKVYPVFLNLMEHKDRTYDF